MRARKRAWACGGGNRSVMVGLVSMSRLDACLARSLCGAASAHLRGNAKVSQGCNRVAGAAVLQGELQIAWRDIFT